MGVPRYRWRVSPAGRDNIGALPRHKPKVGGGMLADRPPAPRVVGCWCGQNVGWVEAKRVLSYAFCRNPSSPLQPADGFRQKNALKARFFAPTHPTKSAYLTHLCKCPRPPLASQDKNTYNTK